MAINPCVRGRARPTSCRKAGIASRGMLTPHSTNIMYATMLLASSPTRVGNVREPSSHPNPASVAVASSMSGMAIIRRQKSRPTPAMKGVSTTKVINTPARDSM